jgi:hypothetical protein
MSTPQKSREIRLGIVMYGGVSLAIYINGVSQELFRAVQGEGIYRLLKLCFDTDIIVDIVSGTSAGGINGLLLAYALANGSDFSRTKDLWRDNGDIAKLMYEANADPAECKSLLDSDNFYRDRLARPSKILMKTHPPAKIASRPCFLRWTYLSLEQPSSPSSIPHSTTMEEQSTCRTSGRSSN